MDLRDIKDKNLTRYLNKEIGIDKLKSLMTGKEFYEVVDGEVKLVDLKKKSELIKSCSVELAKDSLTVIVTCHQKYVDNGWLYGCLKSIDNQTIKCEKILCLDDCVLSKPIQSDWLIISGNWHSPNPARNEGLKASRTEWVIFFDSDNLMLPDYAEKMLEEVKGLDSSVAILYPDLYDHDIDMKPIGKRTMKDYCYWSLRNANFCDTSSAWKRVAVEQVGGFKSNVCGPDDWFLAKSITEKGWKAKHFKGPPVIYRNHTDSRWRDTFETWNQQLWENSTFTLVTPFAGRFEVLETWENFVLKEDLPPNIDLFVVDDSGNVGFNAFLKRVLNNVSYRFSSVTLQINKKEKKDLRDIFERHKWIANIYSVVFSMVFTDYVVTLEDDVEPLPGSLRKMFAQITPSSRVGIVGAAYSLPEHPQFACAALEMDRWHCSPLLAILSDNFTEVGFVGGGFTLYSGSAINGVPIYSMRREDFNVYGWDANICWDVREKGWKVVLAEGVCCAHHLNDRKK